MEHSLFPSYVRKQYTTHKCIDKREKKRLTRTTVIAWDVGKSMNSLEGGRAFELGRGKYSK